jgi:hypothetical protein
VHFSRQGSQRAAQVLASDNILRTRGNIDERAIQIEEESVSAKIEGRRRY